MKEKKINFIPIFLGSDAGAYGMARSFHEKYGIKTICLDTKDLVFCRYSDIVDVIIDENLDNDDFFCDILIEFSKKFNNRKLILMAFCDIFVEKLIKNKKKLDKYYIIPTTNYDLYKSLAYKDKFYEFCNKYNLKYPNTIVYSYQEYLDNSINLKKIEKLDYPMVLKAANSCAYWQLEFYGKKKAYKINNFFELISTIHSIYSTTYRDNLIIQEYISGNDDSNYILNCYSDKNGNVKYVCMGRILLEEKGPTGIGSPSAIINYFNQEIVDKIKSFLEDIHYIGYSNFDFKYDKKDDSFKLLEVNLRLGRSSYYANNDSFNLSELIVEDYIYENELNYSINKDENLWCIIPPHIIFEWIKDEDLSYNVYKLFRKDKIVNSLYYNNDLNEDRELLLQKKMLKYIEIYNFYKKNGAIKNEDL